MNKKIFVLLVLPLFLSCIGVGKGVNEYKELVLGADGAWCWFSDPRAIVVDDKLITGWVTSNGTIQSAERSFTDEMSQITDVKLDFEANDHVHPSFVKAKDQILIFYTKHAGDDGIYMRKKGINETNWGPEKALKLHNFEKFKEAYNFEGEEKDIHTDYTYSNPMYLEEVGANGRLFLFWRGLNYKPNYSYSDDLGENWEDAQVAISSAELNSSQRPYVKYFSNGKDTIHIAFTDGHPRDEAENGIYYIKYQNGAFKNSKGEILQELDSVSVDPAKADSIYDGKDGRAWIWDVKEDEKGNARIVYTIMPEEDNHNYYYAELDGTTWKSSFVASGGKWFPETPSLKVEREPHYSAGIVIDALDVDTVYYCSPVDKRFEVFKATKETDKWKASSITEESIYNNIRPYSVAYKGESYLLWMQNTKYVFYKNFKNNRDEYKRKNYQTKILFKKIN